MPARAYQGFTCRGLATTWPAGDSALDQTTLMGLIGLIQILWKIKSEMEICKQENVLGNTFGVNAVQE